MRRPRFGALALWALGAGCLGAGFLTASQPGSYKNDFADLEWLTIYGAQVCRVRLHLEGEGQALAVAWPESIRGQFAFMAARQGDRAVVDKARVERLPSAWALLQKTNGVFANGPGSAPSWKELNPAGADTIEAGQFLEYYRRAGLCEALFATGKVAVEKPLTLALAKALDANGDGQVTDKELALAENLLGKLDANGDELITPGELLPKVSYPGAAGTHWLRPPTAQIKETAWNRDFPLIMLPQNRADTTWCEALISRLDRNADLQLEIQEIAFESDLFARLDRDRNGKLSPAELASLRDQPPEVDWSVALGKQPSMVSRSKTDPALARSPSAGKERAVDRLEVSHSGMRLAVRADTGSLAPLWREFRDMVEAKYREADPQGTGHILVSPEKAAPMSEWACVLYLADGNLDGKVSQAELTSWLDANEAHTRSVATITLLDHGTGFFALLDADQDGALSLRELRSAKIRLEQAGAMQKGFLSPERIPGQMRITVGFGPPKRLLFPKAQKGPAWFLAMDRNQDGDLSRKECPFPAEWFDRYDKDHDGLIDFQEAAAIPMAQNELPALPSSRLHSADASRPKVPKR